ncbi:hypothetical protein CsSME_00007666 [Camellia sinensis var. sinensis]
MGFPANGSSEKPLKFLIYGRIDWIGGLLGKLCESQGIDYVYGSGRLENRSSLDSDLASINSTLLGSFETHQLLGWAVPYCPGGDLNVLRYRQADHIFSPSVIRFYLAAIVCAPTTIIFHHPLLLSPCPYRSLLRP